MALSGGLILLFLLGHALGNLLIFINPNTLNTYAHWLQHSPFLWVFRLTMLALFSLHIFLALRVYFQNRSARPIAYAIDKDIQLSLPAKMMFYTGLTTFIFILFHLAHLTIGWVPTTSFELLKTTQMVDVYSNLVRGFNNPYINFFYLFSMLAIGLHLHHALKSLFQTLGFHNQGFHQLLNYMSPILIGILMLAFISIPISVTTGFLN